MYTRAVRFWHCVQRLRDWAACLPLYSMFSLRVPVSGSKIMRRLLFQRQKQHTSTGKKQRGNSPASLHFVGEDTLSTLPSSAGSHTYEHTSTPENPDFPTSRAVISGFFTHWEHAFSHWEQASIGFQLGTGNMGTPRRLGTLRELGTWGERIMLAPKMA